MESLSLILKLLVYSAPPSQTKTGRDFNTYNRLGGISELPCQQKPQQVIHKLLYHCGNTISQPHDNVICYLGTDKVS